MSEPTAFEFFIAAVGLAVFLVAAWKLASWFTRRGQIIRPLTLMDSLMTKTEKVAAKKKRALGASEKDV